MRYFRSIVVILLALATAAATAQVVYVPRGAATGAALGSSIGRGMGDALSAIREGRILAANFNRDFAQAKQDFSSSPVGSSAEAEALERLTQMLDTIDVYEFVSAKSKAVAGGGKQMDSMLKLTYGEEEFGGGLQKGTGAAFGVWTSAMLRHIKGKDNQFGFDDMSAAKDVEAFRATESIYRGYVQLRNWVVYYEAGKGASYFASAQEYLDFYIRFFPNEFDAGFGAFNDQFIVDTRNTLFALFGEDTVMDAAEQLRQQPQYVGLRLKDPAALGLSPSEALPPRSLTGLLRADASTESFGVLAMGAYTSLSFLDDAQLRLAGWREQHSQSSTDRVLRDVQKRDLDDAGKLVDAPYAGMTLLDGVLSVLPLDPDPVAVRRAELRKQQEEAQLAQRAEAEKRQQENLAARKTAAAAVADEQLGIFLAARDIVDLLDQDRITFLDPAELDDPSVNGRLYRDLFDDLVAKWNQFTVSGKQKDGRAAQKARLKLRDRDYRMSPEMVPRHRQVFDLVKFVNSYKTTGPKDLSPLADAQAARISAGTLSQNDAMDMSFDYAAVYAERYAAWQAQRQAIAAEERAQREAEQQQQREAQQQAAAERQALANSSRSALRSRETGARDSTGRRGDDSATSASRRGRAAPAAAVPDQAVVQTKAAAISAADQLDGFMAARGIAQAADAAYLGALNQAREAAGLEIWNDWTYAQQTIELTAGFWEQHRLNPEVVGARSAASAFNSLKRMDREAYAQCESVIAFLLPKNRSQLAATGSLGEVQATRLRAGSVAQADALPLLASRDLQQAINREMQERLKLHNDQLKLAEAQREGNVAMIKRYEARVESRSEGVTEKSAALKTARASAEAGI